MQTKQGTRANSRRRRGGESLPAVALPVVLLAAEARWPVAEAGGGSAFSFSLFVFFSAAPSSSSSSSYSFFLPLLPLFSLMSIFCPSATMLPAPPQSVQHVESGLQVGVFLKGRRRLFERNCGSEQKKKKNSSSSPASLHVQEFFFFFFINSA